MIKNVNYIISRNEELKNELNASRSIETENVIEKARQIERLRQVGIKMEK